MLQVAWEEAVYRAQVVSYWVRGGTKVEALRKILVNGSPKTGTTWMSLLLKSLPGFQFSGHVIQRKGKLLRASPGEIFHGHLPYSPELQSQLDQSGVRTILMVRDPRDQTVSRMFHIRRQTSHPWHKRFGQMDEDEALMACIEGRHPQELPDVTTLIALTRSWRAAGKSVCRVRYEDLLGDPSRQMHAVFDFLSIQVSDGLLESIIKRNRFERLTIGRNIFRLARARGEPDPASHFRKGIKGDWRNYFKPEHTARFKELAGDMLIEWGYEAGTDW
jgi:hypothetical protein